MGQRAINGIEHTSFLHMDYMQGQDRHINLLVQSHTNPHIFGYIPNNVYLSHLLRQKHRDNIAFFPIGWQHRISCCYIKGEEDLSHWCCCSRHRPKQSPNRWTQRTQFKRWKGGEAKTLVLPLVSCLPNYVGRYYILHPLAILRCHL